MRIATTMMVAAGLVAAHATDRYVSLTGGHLPPFTSWADAATNIQDAVDAAVAGDTVWVTNGLYNTGGKVMAGDLTNRVAIDKAITVQSVNGPMVTMIEGVSPGQTGAVRCVWMTNGASLIGFSVRKGLTQSSGDAETLQRGGGIWCASTNATITNCLLRWNRAWGDGGGIYRGTVIDSTLFKNGSNQGGGGGASQSVLARCVLRGNDVRFPGGGGAHLSTLTGCAIVDNHAFSGSGGGAYNCRLTNCTVAFNSSGGGGSGGGGVFIVSSAYHARNCIVYSNTTSGVFGGANYNTTAASGSIQYSCTTPLPPGGTGNIASAPQLMSDGIHLAETSPCRGAGSVSLVAVIDGSASGLSWDFGDGVVSSNLSYLTSHTWTNVDDYTVTFTAYNNDHPVGVSTNVTIHVVPLVEPELSAGSLSNSTFTLNLFTQPGVTYQVEQATNLTPPVVRSLVKSVSGTGDLVPVSDTTATNEMRFYRARVP